MTTFFKPGLKTILLTIPLRICCIFFLPLQLTTLRGSILEDAIPSTSRHGSTRGLPAKDILEHVCPELQLNALRLTLPGPKVGMVVTEVRKRLNY